MSNAQMTNSDKPAFIILLFVIDSPFGFRVSSLLGPLAPTFSRRLFGEFALKE